MSADPIPAIREADATGDTAALYEDIRRTLRVPFVNLVWRHLASIEGGLEWTWPLVKPLYGATILEDAAARIETRPSLAGIRPLPDHVLASLGAGDGEQARIANMLEGYIYANARAVLVLSAARHRLTQAAAGADAALARVPERRMTARTPPLPGLDELSPPIVRLVHELNRFGLTGETHIVASLYRHLAHWPGFLGAVWIALKPLHADGRLCSDTKAVSTEASHAGATLAEHLQAPEPPPRAEVIDAALADFTVHAISRMVVMGDAMRRLIGS